MWWVLGDSFEYNLAYGDLDYANRLGNMVYGPFETKLEAYKHGSNLIDDDIEGLRAQRHKLKDVSADVLKQEFFTFKQRRIK